MAELITTLGNLTKDQLGMILPHEHFYVDIRIPDETPEGYAEADVDDVLAMMVPEVEAAQALGVTAIVECSMIGVGRRADMNKAISDATNLPIVVPTGIYREPWTPKWVHDASEDEIYEWMMQELTDQIEDSGVQAAWIKLGGSDDGLTETEIKFLRAAARAGKETNAVIGSHTIRGRVARHQINIIEEMGYTAEKFIWIHTQFEDDFDLHLELAERGVWIEYDQIGKPGRLSDEAYIELIQKILDAGYEKKLLLSQDRGWYHVSDPAREPLPFTYILDTFFPKLREAGVGEDTITQIMHDNAFNVYAR